MGILPLEFIGGQNSESLGLKGDEIFDIILPETLGINDKIQVVANTGTKFEAKSRLDTAPEIEYYRNKGILVYVMRKIMRKSSDLNPNF